VPIEALGCSGETIARISVGLASGSDVGRQHELRSRGALELSPFFWEVPAEGFRWADEPTDEDGVVGRSLILASETPALSEWKRYKPLERATLFQTFAATPPTEDGILAFANEYGLFGDSSLVLLPKPITLQGDPSSDISGLRGDLVFYPVGIGESFEHWSDEIAAMRRAVDLWAAARDHTIPPIRRVLGGENLKRTQANLQTQINTLAGWPLFPWPDVSLSLSVAPYSDADPTLTWMAWFEVQEAINRRLTTHVAHRMTYSPDCSRPRLLRLIPKNLLGALWLQFARAVDGGKEYRICSYCPLWIEPSENGRVTRRYCSTRCRRKAFDARKRKVRDLRARGVPVSRIAGRLGATEEKVRS